MEISFYEIFISTFKVMITLQQMRRRVIIQISNIIIHNL